MAVLTNTIHHGQTRTKEFRTDVDPGVAAHSIFGACMSALLHQNLFRESLSYDPLYATLDRLVLDGIVAR